jgi:exodeoxyribonuclease-5
MNIEKDKIIQAFAVDLYPSQVQGLSKLVDWWRSAELECTLEGFAGTGKTYLLKTFITNIVDKSFTITAPTHKALRVAEQHIGVKGKTLQSLHGLKPNVELATFDINNLQFDTLGLPKIQNYSLVIIDESSMVNKHVKKLTLDRAKQYNVKILWVGDEKQLPPVKEKKSEVFTNVKTVIKLDTIIRQSKDNPILHVFDLLRNDIDNNTSTALTYLAKNRNGMKGDIGYQVVNVGEYKELMLQYFSDGNFFDNLDYVRAMSYTNIMTSTWNEFIRNKLFDTPKQSLTIQDLLTSYKTLVDDNNAAIITNSEDYIISDIRPHVNEFKLRVNCVILKSAFSGKETTMLQILEHRDLETLGRYIGILEKLRNSALTGTGSKRWYPYFKFKNQILCMIDIEVSGQKLTRELDYGYTLTTHKLQGSTFDNVFVDGDDICNPISKWGKKRPNDINLRNRLLYVALSRAKYKAFIKF